MWKRVMSQLSYANVVATLALFFALSGGAYALVVNGALVQDESLTGRDVLNDSLTGNDVNEETLRGLPRMLTSSRPGFEKLVPGETNDVSGPVAVGEGATVAATATARLSNTGPDPARVGCSLVDQSDRANGALGSDAVTLDPRGTANLGVSGSTGSALGRMFLSCNTEGSHIVDLGGSLTVIVAP